MIGARRRSAVRARRRTQPDVVALHAHGLGDHADTHEHCEDLATEAEREYRLESGRDDQQPEEDVRDRGLREALRWPGYRPRLHRESWRDYSRDELAKRARGRAGQDAGEKAVGDHRGQ